MGREMTRSLRYALATAFILVITAVAVSAVALGGHDLSAKRPSGGPTARTPAALTEQIRVDRRDSRHGGCSKRARRLETPDV
jgi:hypothetical protein